MQIENLYSAFAKMVFNLALHYTQNTQDAEEITQDVFVKLFEKGDQFKGEASAKTYITRITINQSLDFLRYKSRQKRGGGARIRTLDDSQHETGLHDFNHPGYKLEQKEEIAKIYAALNKLPPNQKTVIILLKIEGHTQKEAAEIMNIGTKAIESLFQRAKKGLRTILESNEGKTLN